MKKICFAISVHEKREVIKDLLENIQYFCPNSSIVLFQSGDDPKLCEGLNVLVCPTSRPLTIHEDIAFFHLSVMEWLEAVNSEYDYLTIIDSDALFAKKGFEQFLLDEMEGYDYMAPELRYPNDDWYPGIVMKSIWSQWQPLFQIPYFKACFNPGQTFSKKFVKAIISYPKLAEIKRKIVETKTCVIEEILFPTLAEMLGVNAKSYPYSVQQWIRYRPYFTKEEIAYGVHAKKIPCYIVHPVHRNLDDPARSYIRSLKK